jgi:hypothetical protein
MSDAQANSDHHAVGSTAGTLELAARAARDGAADAREAANRTWEATSLFARRFIYTTCYTVSYGVVFPSMLLARSIPRDNAAVRGLIDGAHAAVAKLDELSEPVLEPSGAEAAPALAPS